MTILDEIIKDKEKEVEKKKKILPMSAFKESPLYGREIISIKKSLIEINKPGIIAEHKRQSPSKGIINDEVNLEDVVSGYQKAGAVAVSVLTDEKYFMGIPEDVVRARQILNIPILRKEFMIDEYQVYEAKAIGADFILLIASCLSKSQSENLAGLAKQLGMDVLIEIHTEEELNNVPDNVDIVGVNNRNLKTFEVDINNSISLSKSIPDQFVKISESGISDTDSIKKLWQHGFKGFLIGENFMKTENPGESCIAFINELYK